MDNELKVISVTSSQGTRIGKIFNVEFLSNDITSLQDIFSIVYEEKTYYFQVVEIYVTHSSGKFHVIANETGYSNKFSKKGKFDIRKLIGLSIEKVIDEDKIKEVNKASCYC
jgi:hypothetical protein